VFTEEKVNTQETGKRIKKIAYLKACVTLIRGNNSDKRSIYALCC